MRVVVIPILLMICSSLLPAAAHAQSASGRWDFAVGPHLIHRENSSDENSSDGSSDRHVGGGLTVARDMGRFAAVVEAGGTRREGHNDWRALGGIRATLGDRGRTLVFAQALAGTVIRQHEPDWAVAPGLGVDLRFSERSAIRFQIDAPIERSDERTVAGIRASVWLTLFSRKSATS